MNPCEELSDCFVSKQKEATGSGDKAVLHSLSVSKDATWAVVGCEDYSLKQVKLTAPEQGDPSSFPNMMTSKLRHKGAVYCTALTDEDQAVSGSGDNTVLLWDMARDEPVLEMLGHEASVHCCGVMANGRSLISGSFDHTVRRWDTLSGSSVQKLVVADNDTNVNAVTEVADGFIATGTSDGLVCIFDLRKADEPIVVIGEKKSGWEVGQDIVSCCSLAAQGTTVLCGYSDGLIRQLQLKPKSKGFCTIC